MASDSESFGKYLMYLIIFTSVISVVSLGIYLYMFEFVLYWLIIIVPIFIFIADTIMANHYKLFDKDAKRRKRLYFTYSVICAIVFIILPPFYLDIDYVIGSFIVVFIGVGVFSIIGIIIGGLVSFLSFEIKKLDTNEIISKTIQYDIKVPSNVPLTEYFKIFTEHYSSVLDYDFKVWSSNDGYSSVFREQGTPNYILIVFHETKFYILPFLKKGIIYLLNEEAIDKIRVISEMDFQLNGAVNEGDKGIQKVIEEYQNYVKPGKTIEFIRKEIKKVLVGIFVIAVCIAVLIYIQDVKTYLIENTNTLFKLVIATVIGTVIGHFLTRKRNVQKE